MTPTSAARGFRLWLVLAVGTPLLLFNAFFGTYVFVVVQALIWTQTSLLRGPVVILCVLAAANGLFVRTARRSGLSQSEMLALYSMICIGTCAGGFGFVQILINEIAGVYYYASPGNHWQQTLWPQIPWWLAPRDPAVIDGFFRGRTNLYARRILVGWAAPLLAWSSFIFALFWVLLCASSLLRLRWVEEERLSFPMAALPLAMTDVSAGTKFWRNRWMWAGFLLAGALESLDSLNFLMPWIPGVTLKPIGKNMLDQYLNTRPWSQAGMFRIAFYPWVIGIAFLLSLDVSFSCWFLYLGVKAANVFTAMLGFAEGGASGPANRAPYIREQSLGAFVGIALLSLWMARRGITQAWYELDLPWRADRRAEAQDELMPPGLALLGGAVGVLFLVGFLVAAGLSAGPALLFVDIYLCFAVTLARIVSEAGAGWAWAPNWSTTSFVADAFGGSSLSPQHLTVLFGYTEWTNDMRDNPMPQQMVAARLAGSSARSFLWPMVWAAAFGVVCAFWAHLEVYYTYGAATGKVRLYLSSLGTEPFRHAAAMIATPPRRDSAGMIAAAIGGLIALGLSLIRQRVLWWPFHPLGYALATTNSMDYMWFPFLLAWGVKSVILRYGGIRAYRTALPFFLGLILGDFVVPSLWGIFGMLSGSQQYMAFPH